MIQRSGTIAYAAVGYLAFLAAMAWAVVFVAGAGTFKTVDSGSPASTVAAIVVDLALLSLFAAQHTVMARSAFKRWLTSFLPPAAERSTFVLMASATLIAVFWLWRPINAVLWDVERVPAATVVLLSAYAAGWSIVVASTFMIDHFELFGLRQAYTAYRRRAFTPAAFRVSWLYAWVRHPMMSGLVIAFWATPRMTVGHLLFAAAATAYILVGIRFEERDLRRDLGQQYRDYAAQVPALLPVRRLPGNSDYNGQDSNRRQGSTGGIPTCPITHIPRFSSPPHGPRSTSTTRAFASSRSTTTRAAHTSSDTSPARR